MKKKLLILLLIFVGLIFVFNFINPFRAPCTDKKTEIFIMNMESDNVVGVELEKQGYIKSMITFDIVMALKGNGEKVQEGGYYLSKNMSVFQIADEITNGPDLKWVTVLEGMRKEQIGEKLKDTFGWSDEELDKWNNTYTSMRFDYTEGVFFPDTYLIPVHEDGLEIANRMIARFEERFSPYYDKFSEKDIKWTTAVKIASIIQREAGGKNDMPLIAGILWNRLLKNMKLDIDATVQYARRKTTNGWWSRISSQDIKDIDSPYNTYKYAGLPPTPISNPGLDAIDAVLNSEETDCLYYLHDSKSNIHCAKTYKEHLENINNYLRN